MGWRCLLSTVNILAFLRKGYLLYFLLRFPLTDSFEKEEEEKKEIAVNLFHDYGLNLAFLRLTTTMFEG